MMKPGRFRVAGLFGMLFCLSACNQQNGPKIDKVDVFPVKGIVTVDGAPQAGVEIRCEAVGSFDYGDLAVGMLHGTTNANGEFTMGTYAFDDGLPPGEYKLTFKWPLRMLMKKSQEDEKSSDQLKGKYEKGKDSPIPAITVAAGEPLDVGTIELKTK